MTQKIKLLCPLCKVTRDFLRVVEAHEEGEPFTSSTVIGSRLRRWIQRTVHPIAYCPICRIVLFVGPSADKVEQDFKEEEAEEQKKREKGFMERYKIEIPNKLKKKIRKQRKNLREKFRIMDEVTK